MGQQLSQLQPQRLQLNGLVSDRRGLLLQHKGIGKTWITAKPPPLPSQGNSTLLRISRPGIWIPRLLGLLREQIQQLETLKGQQLLLLLTVPQTHNILLPLQSVQNVSAGGGATETSQVPKHRPAGIELLLQA